jgi:hypothetical protein
MALRYKAFHPDAYHRRERFAGLAGLSLRRPNSMNRDGLVLDEVGFEPLVDDLRERVAAPLGRALFAHVGGDALDHHHGFTASPTRTRRPTTARTPAWRMRWGRRSCTRGRSATSPSPSPKVGG